MLPYQLLLLLKTYHEPQRETADCRFPPLISFKYEHFEHNTKQTTCYTEKNRDACKMLSYVIKSLGANPQMEASPL